MKGTVAAAQLKRFRQVIAQQLGLRLNDSQLAGLADILLLRMEVCALTDVEAYLRLLTTSRDELRAVVGDLTVPETYFFRIPNHFRALAEVVLPRRVRARMDPRELQILSAGCASGEETYSMAMLVRDRVDLRACKVAIRGVDINPAVLAKARSAKYSARSLRETPDDVRSRFFRSQGRQFQLDDSIRKMVSFEEGNLMDPRAEFWHPDTYDVIFFRNVLMYFSSEAIKEVIARMVTSLAPGGYLFLGPAETLRGITQDFHLCHTHDAFYYQRREADDMDAAPAPLGITTGPASFPGIPAKNGEDWPDVIRRTSERIEKLARKSALPPQHASRPKPTAAPSRRELTTTEVSTAWALLRQERFGDALDALHSSEAWAGDHDVQLLRAVLLANAGELSQAEAACKALLNADALNAGAHYIMALCRENAADQHAAAEHDSAAAYLDPSFAMPHLHLGLLAKRGVDPETARRELSQAALLLAREDAARILLFGGGFSREALIELCRRELRALGATA